MTVVQIDRQDADESVVAENEDPTPWWKPTLDSRGRLLSTKKPPKGFRRWAEIARNAVVPAIVVGALTQAVIRNVVVTGIVVWVVLILVLLNQLRPFGGSRQ